MARKTSAPLIGKIRAKQAFRDFTGREPQNEYVTQLDSRPVAGYRMGSTVGIAYEANRDGKTERYFHEFKKKARPDLVARSDGRQLFLTRGNYKVTDRGIEDMGVPLFVVNPSKRPSQRKGKPAMARRLRRKRRSTAVTVFNRNPIRRRRRRATIHSFARNPIRRHRRRRAVASYRRNPIRRRSYRRNPIGMPNLSFRKMLLPAAAIGVGAVGSELVMGYLPIPATLKTGVLRHITKGVVSLVIGWGIANLLKQRKMGEAFALGGLVIAVHDATKEAIVKFMPNAQFGQYIPTGMGASPFLPRVGGSPGGPTNTLSYYSPGAMQRMGQYMPAFGGAAADGYDSDFRP